MGGSALDYQGENKGLVEFIEAEIADKKEPGITKNLG